MKVSIYKELEPRRRFLTVGWVGAILGAHLLVFGGGYIVTQFGSKEPGPAGEAARMSRAGANGLVTWSSQSPDAQDPTVDGASATLFDNRAGDLTGYNGGAGKPILMANAQASSTQKRRFEPRRPSDSSSSDASRSPSNGGSFSQSRNDDAVLRPIGVSGQPESVVSSSSEPSRVIEYKVQNGDSLWGISKRFGVTVKDIEAVNPGIKAPSIRVGQTINVPRSSGAGSSTPSSATPTSAPAPKVDGSVYVVKSGDSLSRIASRQGVTVSELKRANGKTSDMIRIGEELVIPSSGRKPNLPSRQHTGQKHVVEPGDSLSKLAAIYGVSTRELMVLNDIQDPRNLRIGQTLLIPGRASAQPPTPAPPVKRAPVRQTPTLQTLDSIEFEEEPEDLPTLNTLDTLNEFDEDDLDEQPLIPIE